MDYKFPRITHIDDVLPAIEGRDEFIVAERPWGKVVNYLVVMPDTFPVVQTEHDAIRRECRGLIFYPNGRIMSRRLHKFFNVNEREETRVEKIDLRQPHVILEKLDGSMITPIFTDEGVRWGTKMGLTEVSAQAEAFVAERDQYARFAENCRQYGKTPIFEWCSRSQRIVVDHPTDRLVLIAVRDNETGAYAHHSVLEEASWHYDMELVESYTGTAENMQALVDLTRDMENTEGYVLRFDDGHMVKVKAEWYVRIHKTKDNLLHEKNVIDMIVNENMDDVKSFMLDADRERVEEFEAAFWSGVEKTVAGYDLFFTLLQGMDKKTYALQHMKKDAKTDPFLPAFMFGRMDGKDMRTMVLDKVRQHLSSQTKVDAARHLWSGARWEFQTVLGD